MIKSHCKFQLKMPEMLKLDTGGSGEDVIISYT